MRVSEQQIIKSYKELPLMSKVAQKYGIAPKTVKNILDRNGIERLSTAEAIAYKNKLYRELYRTYSFDKNYFKKLNKNNAYIIGFILADGSIMGNRLKLSLQRRDRDLLVWLKQDCQYTGSIYDNKAKCNNNYYPASSLTISCYEWFEDLEKYSIYPNKTLTSFLPNIPSNFFGHFLRGFFDGDGTITGKKYQILKFTNGSPRLLSELSDRLHNEYGLTERGVYHQQNSQTHTLEYGKHSDVKKLYDLMYEDVSFYLQRKKDKFINV